MNVTGRGVPWVGQTEIDKEVRIKIERAKG